MAAEKRILLVLNPISGDLNKEDFRYYTRSHAAEKGYALFEFNTTGHDDHLLLREKIKEVQPERVIVAGGDGTITLAAATLQELPGIVLGIVPLGSSNGLAVSFGIPINPAEAWETALLNEPTLIDGVLLNGELSLHLSDLGFNALLVKNFEASETRGKIGYALELLKTVREHRFFRVRITTGTLTREFESAIVVIANADKYGTGFRINAQGKINDGFFEIIVVKRMNMGELGKLWPGNMEEENQDLVKVLKVKESTIEVLDEPVPFQIDGEYKGEVRLVNARILPAFLPLALPS